MSSPAVRRLRDLEPEERLALALALNETAQRLAAAGRAHRRGDPERSQDGSDGR